ncbi:putative phosphatidate phosphatase [Lupinus albus]|uniref:Putative phosphatidate phosphatase n=1 Tax=Lupinus albus TaxID=3870 RepID=A0A6A4NDC4_LUPAL|nr:putative phosphatidate phosphatase [Lupinus albus]
MATPPLKAVTLTHVRYQKGDKLGHLLAWVSLIPVFISLSGFITHFIFRRELQGIFFFIGLVISQFINEIIKTTVHQARPDTCVLLETCDSNGWPSSHSQVYLGYHTVAQVFAGTALGIFLGAVWFWVVNNVLYLCFPIIEESVFGRVFYVKDTSHIQNVLKFEYDKARAERQRLASISKSE